MVGFSLKDFFVFFLVLATVAGMWKVFEKAGKPGWASLIPIYNWYVLIKLAGRPGWWIVFMFIPIAVIVVQIIVCIDLARRFGKGALFGLGLALLPFIFFPLLGFEDAEFREA
jgi:hypothetical protein